MTQASRLLLNGSCLPASVPEKYSGRVLNACSRAKSWLTTAIATKFCSRSQFTAPSNGELARLEFAAEVKWLVCREVCIPEHANLRLTLPVSTTTDLGQQHAQLFAKTDKLLPQPLPSGWKASVTSAKDDFILNIRSNKPITQAIFFPLDPGQIDNSAPQELQPIAHGAEDRVEKI